MTRSPATTFKQDNNIYTHFDKPLIDLEASYDEDIFNTKHFDLFSKSNLNAHVYTFEDNNLSKLSTLPGYKAMSNPYETPTSKLSSSNLNPSVNLPSQPEQMFTSPMLLSQDAQHQNIAWNPSYEAPLMANSINPNFLYYPSYQQMDFTSPFMPTEELSYNDIYGFNPFLAASNDATFQNSNVYNSRLINPDPNMIESYKNFQTLNSSQKEYSDSCLQVPDVNLESQLLQIADRNPGNKINSENTNYDQPMVSSNMDPKLLRSQSIYQEASSKFVPISPKPVSGLPFQAVSSQLSIESSNLNDKLGALPALTRVLNKNNKSEGSITKKNLKYPKAPKIKSDTDEHKRRVIKEKVHPCSFPGCTKKFSRLYNMVSHLEIHRPDRTKDFECPTCNKYFSRKHDMTRHMKNVHKF